MDQPMTACPLHKYTHYRTQFTLEPRVWCDCCCHAIIEVFADDLDEHASQCTCTNETHKEYYR